MNKIIYSILALSLLLTSCMDRQGEVETPIDPGTHPKLVVTLLDPSIDGSVTNEVDALSIPFSVELTAPLQYPLNIGAKVIGGTADEDDFTYAAQVIPAYEKETTFNITIVPDGDVTEETEELVVEIGAFTLDNMFLVSPGSGTVLNLTIENCADCFTCDWNIHMYDAYGDGWNGASITIDAEGIAATYNMTNDPNSDGAFAQVFAPVPHNKDITISFNSGDWDEEVTFEIFDAAGNLVLVVDTAPPPVGVLYTGHNDCP